VLHVDCTPPLLAPRSRGGPASRLARRLAPVLTQVVLVAALGCGEDAQSPTPPDPTPTLAATSTPLFFRQVSAGGVHTCGVTMDYRAYCWGGNWGGNPLTPVAVAGGLHFLEVSAGGYACGVTTDELAYCWGSDLTPVAVPGGRRFRQVSSGADYTCGVDRFHVAFCWGRNRWGRLGTGGTGWTGSTTPVRVAGGLRFRRVIAGYSHTCGTTTDYRAYCWGFGLNSQLGDGKNVTSPKPVAVAGGLSFRQVRPGSGWIPDHGEQVPDYASSCGVTTDDRAYCWGVAYGRTPVAVAGGRRYRYVSPGAFSACGVTIFDVALCWGENTDGQLGIGAGSSATPALVAGGLRFNGVSASGIGRHTCGVTTDHRAYCWGDNSQGQLGDGTTTARSTPVAVAGPM
jgi:alpha-tubulin suppressor-like RCC1 family protein